MSKYEQLQTVFTDGDFVVAALEELGYQPIRSAEPVHLIGYRGDRRPDVAHIVIPRAQIGASSNDIGFVREGGTYQAIISEFDSRSGPAKYGAGKTAFGYNAAWLGRLAQAYKETQTMAVAKARGYVFQGRTVTDAGTVQLRFGVR